MRTGDTVKHNPSGEVWTIAFVDGDDLGWCGWPQGYAKVSDCTLLESCSDEESRKLLGQLADMRPNYGYDRRQAWAQAELERTDVDYALAKLQRLHSECNQLKTEWQNKQREISAARDAWVALADKRRPVT